MTPIYANGMNLNLNEVAFIEFRVNSQPMSGPVALIAVPYEFLKQMHSAMGQAIEQHDKHLHELQRTKANMN
jgi:hypothetical protein